MEQLATYTGRPKTLLAIEVVETHSTSPSTVATHATLIACRRRQNKQRGSRKHVTMCSIDWKLLDSIFEPLHARFNFTLDMDVVMMKVSTRTVTYLIVRRVIQLGKET
jgi:hypothetical protein